MDFSQVLGSKCVEIDAEQEAILNGVGVYLFLDKNSKSLYIGSSVRVMTRIGFPEHHRLNEKNNAASFLVIPCKTIDDARELESLLIEEFWPKQRATRDGKTSRLAELLGVGTYRAAKIRDSLKT